MFRFREVVFEPEDGAGHKPQRKVCKRGCADLAHVYTPAQAIDVASREDE